MPAATAAAEPDDDPPGVWAYVARIERRGRIARGERRRRGLAGDGSPACFSIITTGASARGRQPRKIFDPISVGRSAVSMMSLIPTAMPRSRPGAGGADVVGPADEGADGLVVRLDGVKRLRDRRVSRKLAGSDPALEVGERDHRHFSLAKDRPLLRRAPGSGKRLRASVIPGRCEASNPESQQFPVPHEDRRPGMTYPPFPHAASLIHLPSPGAPGHSNARHDELTDAQRLDWLRLIRSDNVGPRTFRPLVNHFGSARAALEGCPDWRGAAARHGRGGFAARRRPSRTCRRERLGVHCWRRARTVIRHGLRTLDDPPPLLGVRGDPRRADASHDRHRRFAQCVGRRSEIRRLARARPRRGRLYHRSGSGARHRRGSASRQPRERNSGGAGRRS